MGIKNKMQRNMNVLYLLWGEDVSHNNGIFLSQVYTQLYAIHNCFPQINILCVAGIPILKKRILLNWRNYSKKLKKLKMFFCQKNITLVIRNLPILSRFNSSKQYFHYYSLFQKSFIKHLIKKNNIDIVHCRSYHSTYLALKTREKYSLDVKVVFDARGILPEEGVVKQNYTTDSADYSFWKDIEKYLLNYSDKIIVCPSLLKTILRR